MTYVMHDDGERVEREREMMIINNSSCYGSVTEICLDKSHNIFLFFQKSTCLVLACYL